MVKPRRTLAEVTDNATAPICTLVVCAICCRSASRTSGVKSDTLPATTRDVVTVAVAGGIAGGAGVGGGGISELELGDLMETSPMMPPKMARTRTRKASMRRQRAAKVRFDGSLMYSMSMSMGLVDGGGGGGGGACGGGGGL